MLEVKNLSFSYTNEIILQNINFRIINEHAGLIGANGSGKSTLMNLLAHKLAPDSGEIIWSNDEGFSYLDQHLRLFDTLSIEEYLYSVYIDLFKMEEEMNNLYEKMAVVDASEYDKILQKCDYIMNYLQEKGFYMIKSKIGNIINGLGIRVDSKRTIKDLSGGEKAKVFLGKMLLEEKDFLLLDEPTNFLDAVHVDWLIKFLNTYKQGFLVITHNIDFLKSVCNLVLVLENKTIIQYRGSYEQYLELRNQQLTNYQKEYEKQQKYIKKTEEFIKKNIVRATTTKRAQSRQKALEKITILEKPKQEAKVHFDFPFTKSFNHHVLKVEHLSIGYDKILLNNLNFEFMFGNKYVIVGKNGVGKTTFLKTIMGIIKPLSGGFKLSTYNDLLYYAQEENVEGYNAISYFHKQYPLLTEFEIRSILARYGIIGEDVMKDMRLLSGGEICRVRFARLSLQDSNLLILDEPTNHLDKASKKSLFKAIELYPGTVILVSHEKSFYKELNMKEIEF